LMRRMALATGKKAEAEYYQNLFDKIQIAFNKAYVKADGTIGTGSQTSYILALHMQLLPENQRAAATEKLVADIKAHDWHLTTGFLGTPYLLLELSSNGRSDVAYKLLFQNTFPSWAYMIEHGATTMWERWNSDQMMDHPDMNSFNHYAYGSLAEWLYRYAAGIDFDPDDPGFHHIILHPQFDRKLGSVEASYDSQSGTIVSNWKVNAGDTTWSVVIPPNTTARLHFPKNASAEIFESGKNVRENAALKLAAESEREFLYDAGAGSYSFSIKPAH
jgi:alpha-L-rhamnosidase